MHCWSASDAPFLDPMHHVSGERMIGYLCRGGGSIGLGHLARARALLEVAGDALELTVPADSLSAALWATGGFPQQIRTFQGDAPPLEMIQHLHALLIDDYNVADDWILSAHEHTPVVLIDDWQRSGSEAACLVNPNFGARQSDYPSGGAAIFALGELFALVRREFSDLARRRRVDHNRVAVSFGGADAGATAIEVALRLLETSWYASGGSIDLLVARTSDELTDFARQAGERVCVHVRSPDFAVICAAASVVVCASSTVSHEIAALGCAFVPVGTVDNQRILVQRWAQGGIGEALHVGEEGWAARAASLVDRLMRNQDARNALSLRARECVDGKGPERVWGLVTELSRATGHAESGVSSRRVNRTNLDVDR
jgi:spore coat polysaccharide biosynthesis predicted glycosyltransferase SpsG